MSTAGNSPDRPSGAAWRVDLLGGFCLHDGGATRHTRLHSRQVVALLARLAMFPRRDHAREELVELLWPGTDLATGRARLRHALSVLKTILEPAAAGVGTVIDADRHSLRLVAEAVDCDTLAFERALGTGDVARASALYRGELLPGHYGEWILVERARLAALHERFCLAPAVPRLPRPVPVPAASPAQGGCEVIGLPNLLTRVFGVETETVALCAAVRAERLLTLLGPGGGGKSRLAIEVARRLAGEPAAFDSIVRVSLVEATDRREALDAIGRALRIERAEPSLDALVERLAGRRVLLLLDNLEQLVGRGAELAGELASALPALHLLVTSRRSLGLDGARDWPVAPLEPPDADCDLATAAANPAVALFVDRAIGVRRAFRLGARNRAAVVGVVRALDGLPLAIELAAARSRSFAPAELLARLTTDAPVPAPGLDLLARAGPRAAHDARHATMARTIAWSWALLEPAAQRLAGAVAVFRGGCSAAMLQAVVGADDDAALGLDLLLQHNLVQVRGEGEEGTEPAFRFQLYEPIRRFVGARLAPDVARGWRARHRAWAAGWLAAMPATLPIDALRAELPNLCAAFASAATDGGGDDAARLLAGLAPAPEVLTWPVETLRDAARALEGDVDPALRSPAHAVLAVLFYVAGGLLDEAARQADAALASAPPGSGARGRALYAIAVHRWRTGRRPDEVLPTIAEARRLAALDLHSLARLDTLEAFVRLGAGSADAAQALHDRSLERRRALGNRHAIVAGEYNVAHLRVRRRRSDEALPMFIAVAAASDASGDVNLQSRALDAIGECLCELRRFGEAIDALRASVRLAWRHLHRQALVFNLWNLARPLARVGDAERALALAAFAAGLWRTTIGELTAEDERDLRRVRRLCAVQLPAVESAAAWARGESLALVDAVELALAPPRSRGRPHFPPNAGRCGRRGGPVP